MTLTQQFKQLSKFKFSFAKSTEFSKFFALESGAASMYEIGFGLGIPSNLSPENQLRAVFVQTRKINGVFLFNLSSVDMKKAKRGFANFEEAQLNNQITEWELFMIINNKDYFKNCIFHNGKVEFKKLIIWKSVK